MRASLELRALAAVGLVGAAFAVGGDRLQTGHWYAGQPCVGTLAYDTSCTGRYECRQFLTGRREGRRVTAQGAALGGWERAVGICDSRPAS